MEKVKKVAVYVLIVLVGALIAWGIAPWAPVHWVVINLYKHSFGFPLTVVLFLVMGYCLLHPVGETWNTREEIRRRRKLYQAFGFLISFFLILGYWWLATDTYGRGVAESPPVERVQSLPQTGERFVPYEVARVLAGASQPSPTHKVGDIDPIGDSNNTYWVGPVIPHGWGNNFFSRVNNIIVVNNDGNVEEFPAPFRYGEGMYWGHGIKWQMLRKRYFAEYPEIFYIPEKDGKWLGVAPYITYHFSFPVFIPKFGGVMLFSEDGKIEDLTPEEALSDPRLQGRRIFPEWLARLIVSKWGYRFGGLLNVLFVHRGQVDIADLDNTANEMPYYLRTSWGPEWMIAANPAGPSRAVSKIFWIDARTGEVRVYTPPEPLIGPNIGEGFVKSHTPGYNWREKGKDSDSGTYVAIEARPIIRGGALYWEYSVTTFDYKGVNLTVLLNSGNKDEVLHFCSHNSLKRWLEGKGGPDSLPCGGNIGSPPVSGVSSCDLQKMSDEQLIQLIERAAKELESRK